MRRTSFINCIYFWISRWYLPQNNTTWWRYVIPTCSCLTGVRNSVPVPSRTIAPSCPYSQMSANANWRHWLIGGYMNPGYALKSSKFLTENYIRNYKLQLKMFLSWLLLFLTCNKYYLWWKLRDTTSTQDITVGSDGPNRHRWFLRAN